MTAVTLDGGLTYPIVVVCDAADCGNAYETGTNHVERAMCAAELEGWVIDANTEHALCPEHQERP